MRERFSGSMIMVAIAAAAVASFRCPSHGRRLRLQRIPPTPAAPSLKTPWGEPDLQGIWTDETDTPLQRPARYANQEFFTEAQRAEIG